MADAAVLPELAKQVGTIRTAHTPLVGPIAAPVNPTFRRTALKSSPTVLNVSSRNICEIPSQLAQGFLDNTDWGYWAATTGDASWLHERM